MTAASSTFNSFLREHVAILFARPWPVLPAALTIGALNVFLFAFDRPWTASDGLRNWGDVLFATVGLIDPIDVLPPHLYSGSMLNIGLLFGGFTGALPGSEFAARPAPAREAAKGSLGGILMGIGTMLRLRL